jgi:hypothetical protein
MSPHGRRRTAGAAGAPSTAIADDLDSIAVLVRTPTQLDHVPTATGSFRPAT